MATASPLVVFTYFGRHGESAPKNVTDAIVHHSVKVIREKAFYSCKELNNVTIPNTVIRIEKEAFTGCISLQFITLPPDLQCIEEKSFFFCTLLQKIIIPNGVRRIGAFAFSRCKSLRIVHLPSNLAHLGAFSFSRCHLLESLFLPEGLTRIDQGAVKGCKNLKFLNIPDTVNRMGELVVFGCDSIFCDGVEPYDMEEVKNSSTYQRREIRNNDVVNNWLRHRYDSCTLHKTCFGTNVQASNSMMEECSILREHGRDKGSSFASLDYQGMMPLHIIAANHNATADAITACYNAYPAAVEAKDRFDLSPLYYLCKHQSQSNLADMAWLLREAVRNNLPWQDGMREIVKSTIEYGHHGRFSEIDDRTGLPVYISAVLVACEESDLTSLYELLSIDPGVLMTTYFSQA